MRPATTGFAAATEPQTRSSKSHYLSLWCPVILSQNCTYVSSQRSLLCSLHIMTSPKISTAKLTRFWIQYENLEMQILIIVKSSCESCSAFSYLTVSCTASDDRSRSKIIEYFCIRFSTLKLLSYLFQEFRGNARQRLRFLHTINFLHFHVFLQSGS